MEDADAAYDRGDYETALRLLRPLAEQGDAQAQNNLGVMHGNGLGVPQDYVQALMWWNLAASQGYLDVTNARATVAGRMTPAEIAEAEKLEREWRLASDR